MAGRGKCPLEKKKGLYAVLVVLVFLALSGKTMYDRVSSPAEKNCSVF